MTNTILTIAIPTYNRYTYLQELLPNLLRQCQEIDPARDTVEILVINNNSTDKTHEVITTHLVDPRIRYYKNKVNIGGDANFIECVKQAKGQYVWLFGDDDILLNNGLKTLMTTIVVHPCSLYILADNSYESGLVSNKLFQNYNELVGYFQHVNPHYMLAHTLITANVFRRQLFDVSEAQYKISTNYGHMYGLMKNLLAQEAVVYCFYTPIIKVREHRAEFADNVCSLKEKQINYLRFLGSIFNSIILRKYADRLFRKHFLRIVRKRISDTLFPRSLRNKIKQFFRS